MAVRFLERELRRELAGIGREELMRSAVERIGLTDDGGTIYVHLFPKAGSAKAPGGAFVLAWHDYAGDPSQRLECYRWAPDGAWTPAFRSDRVWTSTWLADRAWTSAWASKRAWTWAWASKRAWTWAWA